MSTKHPRLNVVLEPVLYRAVLKLARKEEVSLSLKARDLIRDALEYCEDVHWADQAQAREKIFNRKKTIKHSQVWGS